MISDSNQKLETMEIWLVIPFTICSYPGFTVLHALNITNGIEFALAREWFHSNDVHLQIIHIITIKISCAQSKPYHILACL